MTTLTSHGSLMKLQTFNRLHFSLKMRGEKQQTGTYRVFDMGRWKVCRTDIQLFSPPVNVFHYRRRSCVWCVRRSSPGGRNGLDVGLRWRHVVSGVRQSARKTRIISENNHETNNTCITGFIERATVTRNVMMVIIKLCFLFPGFIWEQY